MPNGINEALQRIRGEIWSRDVALQRTVRVHSWQYTPQQFQRETDREHAWVDLCQLLNPEGVAEGRRQRRKWVDLLEQNLGDVRATGAALDPPVEVQSLEDAAVVLAILNREYCLPPPMRRAPVRAAPWRGERKGPGGGYLWLSDEAVNLPDSLLERLFQVMAGLIDAFLEELQKIPYPSLPRIPIRPVPIVVRLPGRPDPGTGPPVGLPVGFQPTDEGATLTLGFSLTAGSTVTLKSPSVAGPVVIERIAMFSDQEFTGNVQLNLQGSGVQYPTGAVAADVFGDPLILVASNAGGGGSVMPWGPQGRYAEWWPRRLVRLSPFVLIGTVTNSGGVTRLFSAAVDWRAVEFVGGLAEQRAAAVAAGGLAGIGVGR